MRFRTQWVRSPAAAVVFLERGDERIDVVQLPREWVALFGEDAAHAVARALNGILAGLEPKGSTDAERYDELEPMFLASLGCVTGDCDHASVDLCRVAVFTELSERWARQP